MSQTVRIKKETHATLRKIASKSGDSMQATLDKAIESYRRQQILLEANEAYARLQKDPKAWKEELKERKAWEQTLSDGLEE